MFVLMHHEKMSVQLNDAVLDEVFALLCCYTAYVGSFFINI